MLQSLKWINQDNKSGLNQFKYTILLVLGVVLVQNNQSTNQMVHNCYWKVLVSKCSKTDLEKCYIFLLFPIKF